MDTAQVPLNEYEAQRAARIAQNKQRMEALGVLEAVKQLQQSKPVKKRQPSTTLSPAPAQEPIVARASKRIRGQPADAAGEMDTSSPDSNVSSGSAAQSKTKFQSGPDKPRFELTSAQYGAPFLLPSSGITVLELGEIYRGPFSGNFYSSRGCLYRHAYPVGYRASKEVFGHTWDMSITRGDAGPVFTVAQRGGTLSFSGSSPTRPWTDVCLRFKTDRRISGPLYFGFSDVHVQRALAAMYTPAELAYALYGTPLCATPPSACQQPQQQPPVAPGAATPALATTPEPSSGNSADSAIGREELSGAAGESQLQEQQTLAAAEAFATELQAIKGIGPGTAQVLALTTSLGGARHSSLQLLRQWLAADPQHKKQLQQYLLTSEELHPCNRQLPSWSEKWVPLIVQQLMQLIVPAPAH